MARLVKLNDDYAKKIEKKSIICYEKSISYLRELEAKYPEVLDSITVIVDDYARNQGKFFVGNRSFEVCSSELLQDVDWGHSVLLITSDYFREAYDKLVDLVKGIEAIYYFANQETEYELLYREMFAEEELQNIIVFRSGPHAASYVKGMDFADNARALFEYMLKQRLYEKYELVWLVKNPEEYASYKQYPNVKFLSFDWSVAPLEKHRDQYYRVLCLAKYFFFTDAYGFVRNCRKNQVRVQLWHGCGFKTRVNFVRCEKRYEYTTVVSDLYAKIHADIYGLRDDQVLVTGYPKEDWLFHSISKEKLCSMGVPDAGKYIFWLPTFRTTEEKLGQLNEYQMESDSGLPIVGSRKQLEQVNDILQAYNMVLVVKLHPFQKRDEVRCEALSNIFLLDNEILLANDVQINQILGHADALLSDYSSAAVDYLLLNRPIGFTLDDVDRYADSRGFIFANVTDWLPGSRIYEYDEFVKFITEVGEAIDSGKMRRERIRGEMHSFEDDGSCERVLKALGIV